MPLSPRAEAAGGRSNLMREARRTNPTSKEPWLPGRRRT